MNNGANVNRGKTQIALLFLAAAGLLLATIGFIYWIELLALESNRKLTNQRMVIQHLDQLLFTLKDAETGQRGYLLTGVEHYHESYNQAVAEIRTELDDLRNLVSSGDLPGEQVEQTVNLTEQELAELEQTINIRGDRGVQAHVGTVQIDQGKRLIDAIRAQVTEIKREEEVEFERAARQAERAATIRTVVIALIALLNLAFLAWLYRRITHEIDRRGAAVRETDRQRELLATTLASIGEGVIVTDTETRVTFMNGVAASLTGWSAEDSQGIAVTDVFKMINEQTRVTVENPVHCVLSARDVVGLPNHAALVHQDGREIPIDGTGSPICGADSETRGVVLVFRDITERMRADEALRESEERFRLLFQQAAVGIKRLDAQGRLLEVNAKQCDILGYSCDELLQLSLTDITHPEDLPREQAELARLMAREIVNYSIEKRCLHKNGNVIWVRVTSSLPSSNGRHAPWWIAIVEDITTRKQAEEALRRTAKELARSNKDLEQFAYVASHDLQEPLRAVSGFVALLQQRYRGKLDEQADAWIANVVEGAARMQSLIGDLLVYSRVGTKGEALQTTNAQSPLETALHNLAASIQNAGAVITADAMPVVRADAIQLTQLFQNLIGNAIKFRSDRQPQVHVGARREQDAWLFWVRDNGIGIAPEYAERIFLIFQRLHTRTKYPGTGIGLAVCKKIVERHGGKLWVESQPGQGATFYFTISDRGEHL